MLYISELYEPICNEWCKTCHHYFTCRLSWVLQLKWICYWSKLWFLQHQLCSTLAASRGVLPIQLRTLQVEKVGQYRARGEWVYPLVQRGIAGDPPGRTRGNILSHSITLLPNHPLPSLKMIPLPTPLTWPHCHYQKSCLSILISFESTPRGKLRWCTLTLLKSPLHCAVNPPQMCCCHQRTPCSLGALTWEEALTKEFRWRRNPQVEQISLSVPSPISKVDVNLLSTREPLIHHLAQRRCSVVGVSHLSCFSVHSGVLPANPCGSVLPANPCRSQLPSTDRVEATTPHEVEVLHVGTCYWKFSTYFVSVIWHLALTFYS